MDPTQPDQLEGDQEEVTFIDAQGVFRCSLHHDDWADIDWYGEDGMDRSRGIVYRDVTRAAPVPDVSWLLIEPVSYEIHRRSLVITMAVKGLFGSLDEFLEICEKFDDCAAYTALRSLLERLEDESTRTDRSSDLLFSPSEMLRFRAISRSMS
ncbi:hypothetical protein LguiA_026901 [Lonicera macranthoides]